MMLHDDDWSERELGAAEHYAGAVKVQLANAIADIAAMTIDLDDEKRAVVELTQILEEAARVARERLAIDADDFALHALEVFTAAQ